MKYVILAEKTFQYLDLGPDSDEPIFGRKEEVFEMEFSLEDLPSIEKTIRRRLRDYRIIRYEAVHNPATPKQVAFLVRHGYSMYSASVKTKAEASKIISQEIDSWYDDRDRDWPNPLEDWLQDRYNGGGE